MKRMEYKISSGIITYIFQPVKFWVKEQVDKDCGQLVWTMYRDLRNSGEVVLKMSNDIKKQKEANFSNEDYL